MTDENPNINIAEEEWTMVSVLQKKANKFAS
jgi:hypothetical protein